VTLLFKRPLLIKVLSGEKTQTRRRRRPDVKIDGEYRLRKGYNWLQTRITVTGLGRQRLEDITQRTPVGRDSTASTSSGTLRLTSTAAGSQIKRFGSWTSC